MRIGSNIGMLLLAIYLIITGVMGLTAVSIPAVVLPLLALISGIFLLIGR